MDSISRLKTLIAENKTKEAISELLRLTKDTKLSDKVIQQSAKLTQYEEEKLAGIHSVDALNIMRNRINNSLLSIIEQLQTPDEELLEESRETESRKANQKSLWQYITAAAVIIGILGSLAEVFNFINIFPDKNSGATHTVTVLVHGKEGKDDLVLPNRGIVYLIYGDAKIPEQINNEGEATFKQIPERFFAPDAKVEILFEDPEKEPYRVAHRDTSYELKQQSYISLLVVLEGMEQIRGVVEDFETGEPIDSARVRIFGKAVYSNQDGEFTLDIPEGEQKQFITLKASKEGYEDWSLKDIPTTTNQEITIPLKKE